MTKSELERDLLAVANSDMTALERIYQAYYQPVFLLALSMTGDRYLAEDAAQEVFITIRTCAGRYSPGGGGRAWIFGITKNVVRYWIRRNGRESELEEGQISAGPGWESCADELLVNDALAVLSEGEYPVVVLHVFAGLKLIEIAAALNIPYGTVLWRYSEAKKKLKRYYAQDKE